VSNVTEEKAAEYFGWIREANEKKSFFFDMVVRSQMIALSERFCTELSMFLLNVRF
jgi:hypothetical protein